METKVPNKLTAIRTYARDLDDRRSSKPIVAATQNQADSSTVTAEEEPIRATDTLTAEVSRIKTPVTKAAAPKETSLPTLKPITPTKKDPTIIVDNEEAASATIITDTKRDRFKLLPTILSSIKTWFTKKKEDYAAKKIPKYTVPDTTRRKGIIQKATSKSGKFAASDFSSIQERILERKAAANKEKEALVEPSTTWTANTEPGFPLLTESTTPAKITNVQIVPRKTFRAIPEEIVVTEPEPKSYISTQTKNDDDERWVNNVPKAAPATVTPVLPNTPITEIVTAPATPLPTKAEEVTVEAASELETPLENNLAVNKPKFDLLKINTNALTVFISGVVIVFVVIGITGYFMFYKDETVTYHTPIPEALLLDLEVNPLLLYNITEDTIIEAYSTLQNERGTTEGVFMYTSTIGSTNAVSATDILTALKLKVAPDFAQTISTIRVGYINQAPYLILKIKDEAAAQGGLLLWEDTMYQDLKALLILAPEDNSTFLDATINGFDVRVFKNPTGSERLLHGIVSGTIVITTNSASFAQLTELLK